MNFTKPKDTKKVTAASEKPANAANKPKSKKTTGTGTAKTASAGAKPKDTQKGSSMSEKPADAADKPKGKKTTGSGTAKTASAGAKPKDTQKSTAVSKKPVNAADKPKDKKTTGTGTAKATSPAAGSKVEQKSSAEPKKTKSVTVKSEDETDRVSVPAKTDITDAESAVQNNGEVGLVPAVEATRDTEDIVDKELDEDNRDNRGDTEPIGAGISEVELQKRRRENRLIIKVLSAVVCAAVALSVFLVVGASLEEKNAESFFVMYTKDSEDYMACKKGSFRVVNGTITKTMFSKDGNIVFYLTRSRVAPEKFDLFCCELGDKKRLDKGGFIVEVGVEGTLYMNQAGDRLIYTKMSDNGLEAVSYLYSVENKRSVKIASDIKELYVFSSENTAYFLKRTGTKTVLYKYPFGKSAERIAENILVSHFYEADGVSVLLYETGTETAGATQLNIISGSNAPKTIASEVTGVAYERYTAGGNLYYFKSDKSVADWRDIIPDDLEKSDAAMKEPLKSDYTFVFGRSYRYNRAMDKYNEKVSRDSLRDAIDGYLNQENMLGSMKDCYVYTSGGSHKLAYGASADNVLAAATQGPPAIVFHRYEYQKSDTEFSDLYYIMTRSGITAAVNEAAEVLSDVSSSKGVHISVNGNPEGIALTIDNDALRQDSLSFSSDGKTLYYVLEDKDTGLYALYKTMITDIDSAQPELLDEGLDGFTFVSDTGCYRKPTANRQSGTLYRLSEDKPQKIVDDVASFEVFKDGGILIFRNFVKVQSEAIADLYYYEDGNVVRIDERVSLRHLRYHHAGEIAYIREYSDDAGGELCVFIDGNTKKIDTDVNAVLVF